MTLNRRTSIIKLIAGVTCFIFLLESICYAAGADLSYLFPPSLDPPEYSALKQEISIPSEFGIIESSFDHPKNAGLVIHIQDAHGNFESQTHIEKIIRHLASAYGVRLVFLEGSVGQLQPKLFHFFKNPALNLKVAKKLLRRGEFTGAEMALLKQSRVKSGSRAYGVEETALYRQDLQGFRKILGNRKRSQDGLGIFETRIRALEKRLASPDLRVFLKEWRAAHHADANITRYARFLSRQARLHLALELNDRRNQVDYPSFVRLMALMEIEDALREKTGEVEAERKAFLEFIRGKVSEPLRDELSALGSPVSRASDPRRVLEQVFNQLAKIGVKVSEYPHYARYLEHVILRSELEPEKILEEMERVARQILHVLARGKKAGRLIRILRDFMLLGRLLTLELTRKEYRRVNRRQEDFVPSSFMRRIAGLEQDAAQRMPAKPGSPPLDRLFRDSLEFYRLAQEREHAMLENAVGLMQENEDPRAVLVTGGFHSEGIQTKLRAKGLSFISIRPRMGRVQDSRKVYRQTMLRGALPPARSHIGMVLPLTPLPKQTALGWSLAHRRRLIQRTVEEVRRAHPNAEIRASNPYLDSRKALPRLAQTKRELRELAASSLGGKESRLEMPAPTAERPARERAPARRGGLSYFIAKIFLQVFIVSSLVWFASTPVLLMASLAHFLPAAAGLASLAWQSYFDLLPVLLGFSLFTVSLAGISGIQGGPLLTFFHRRNRDFLKQTPIERAHTAFEDLKAHARRNEDQELLEALDYVKGFEEIPWTPFAEGIDVPRGLIRISPQLTLSRQALRYVIARRAKMLFYHDPERFPREELYYSRIFVLTDDFLLRRTDYFPRMLVYQVAHAALHLLHFYQNLLPKRIRRWVEKPLGIPMDQVAKAVRHEIETKGWITDVETASTHLLSRESARKMLDTLAQEEPPALQVLSNFSGSIYFQPQKVKPDQAQQVLELAGTIWEKEPAIQSRLEEPRLISGRSWAWIYFFFSLYLIFIGADRLLKKFGVPVQEPSKPAAAPRDPSAVKTLDTLTPEAAEASLPERSRASSLGRKKGDTRIGLDPRLGVEVRPRVFVLPRLLVHSFRLVKHALHKHRYDVPASYAWLTKELTRGEIKDFTTAAGAATGIIGRTLEPGKLAWVARVEAALIPTAVRRLVESYPRKYADRWDTTFMSFLAREYDLATGEIAKLAAVLPRIYLPAKPFRRRNGKSSPPERSLELWRHTLRHERFQLLVRSQSEHDILVRAFLNVADLLRRNKFYQLFMKMILTHSSYRRLRRNAAQFADEFWTQLYYNSFEFAMSKKHKPDLVARFTERVRQIVREKGAPRSSAVKRTLEILEGFRKEAEREAEKDLRALAKHKWSRTLGIEHYRPPRERKSAGKSDSTRSSILGQKPPAQWIELDPRVGIQVRRDVFVVPALIMEGELLAHEAMRRYRNRFPRARSWIERLGPSKLNQLRGAGASVSGHQHPLVLDETEVQSEAELIRASIRKLAAAFPNSYQGKWSRRLIRWLRKEPEAFVHESAKLVSVFPRIYVPVQTYHLKNQILPPKETLRTWRHILRHERLQSALVAHSELATLRDAYLEIRRRLRNDKIFRAFFEIMSRSKLYHNLMKDPLEFSHEFWAQLYYSSIDMMVYSPKNSRWTFAGEVRKVIRQKVASHSNIVRKAFKIVEPLTRRARRVAERDLTAIRREPWSADLGLEPLAPAQASSLGKVKGARTNAEIKRLFRAIPKDRWTPHASQRLRFLGENAFKFAVLNLILSRFPDIAGKAFGRERDLTLAAELDFLEGHAPVYLQYVPSTPASLSPEERIQYAALALLGSLFVRAGPGGAVAFLEPYIASPSTSYAKVPERPRRDPLGPASNYDKSIATIENLMRPYLPRMEILRAMLLDPSALSGSEFEKRTSYTGGQRQDMRPPLMIDERYATLGDAVLDQLILWQLWNQHGWPHTEGDNFFFEGQHSVLVQNVTLAHLADALLGNDDAELKAMNTKYKSTLMEALIGAVYKANGGISGNGLQKASDLVTGWMANLLNSPGELASVAVRRRKAIELFVTKSRAAPFPNAPENVAGLVSPAGTLEKDLRDEESNLPWMRLAQLIRTEAKQAKKAGGGVLRENLTLAAGGETSSFASVLQSQRTGAGTPAGGLQFGPLSSSNPWKSLKEGDQAALQNLFSGMPYLAFDEKRPAAQLLRIQAGIPLDAVAPALERLSKFSQSTKPASEPDENLPYVLRPVRVRLDAQRDLALEEHTALIEILLDWEFVQDLDEEALIFSIEPAAPDRRMNIPFVESEHEFRMTEEGRRALDNLLKRGGKAEEALRSIVTDVMQKGGSIKAKRWKGLYLISYDKNTSSLYFRIDSLGRNKRRISLLDALDQDDVRRKAASSKASLLKLEELAGLPLGDFTRLLLPADQTSRFLEDHLHLMVETTPHQPIASSIGQETQPAHVPIVYSRLGPPGKPGAAGGETSSFDAVLQSQRTGVFTALLSSRRKPGSSVLNQGTGKTLDSRFRGNDSALNTSQRTGASLGSENGGGLLALSSKAGETFHLFRYDITDIRIFANQRLRKSNLVKTLDDFSLTDLLKKAMLRADKAEEPGFANHETIRLAATIAGPSREEFGIDAIHFTFSLRGERLLQDITFFFSDELKNPPLFLDLEGDRQRLAKFRLEERARKAIQHVEALASFIREQPSDYRVMILKGGYYRLGDFDFEPMEKEFYPEVAEAIAWLFGEDELGATDLLILEPGLNKTALESKSALVTALMRVIDRPKKIETDEFFIKKSLLTFDTTDPAESGLLAYLLERSLLHREELGIYQIGPARSAIQPTFDLAMSEAALQDLKRVLDASPSYAPEIRKRLIELLVAGASGEKASGKFAPLAAIPFGVGASGKKKKMGGGILFYYRVGQKIHLLAAGLNNRKGILDNRKEVLMMAVDARNGRTGTLIAHEDVKKFLAQEFLIDLLPKHLAAEDVSMQPADAIARRKDEPTAKIEMGSAGETPPVPAAGSVPPLGAFSLLEEDTEAVGEGISLYTLRFSGDPLDTLPILHGQLQQAAGSLVLRLIPASPAEAGALTALQTGFQPMDLEESGITGMHLPTRASVRTFAAENELDPGLQAKLLSEEELREKEANRLQEKIATAQKELEQKIKDKVRTLRQGKTLTPKQHSQIDRASNHYQHAVQALSALNRGWPRSSLLRSEDINRMHRTVDDNVKHLGELIEQLRIPEKEDRMPQEEDHPLGYLLQTFRTELGFIRNHWVTRGLRSRLRDAEDTLLLGKIHELFVEMAGLTSEVSRLERRSFTKERFARLMEKFNRIRRAILHTTIQIDEEAWKSRADFPVVNWLILFEAIVSAAGKSLHTAGFREGQLALPEIEKGRSYVTQLIPADKEPETVPKEVARPVLELLHNLRELALTYETFPGLGTTLGKMYRELARQLERLITIHQVSTKGITGAFDLKLHHFFDRLASLFSADRRYYWSAESQRLRPDLSFVHHELVEHAIKIFRVMGWEGVDVPTYMEYDEEFKKVTGIRLLQYALASARKKTVLETGRPGGDYHAPFRYMVTIALFLKAARQNPVLMKKLEGISGFNALDSLLLESSGEILAEVTGELQKGLDKRNPIIRFEGHAPLPSAVLEVFPALGLMIARFPAEDTSEIVFLSSAPAMIFEGRILAVGSDKADSALPAGLPAGQAGRQAARSLDYHYWPVPPGRYRLDTLLALLATLKQEHPELEPFETGLEKYLAASPADSTAAAKAVLMGILQGIGSAAGRSIPEFRNLKWLSEKAKFLAAEADRVRPEFADLLVTLLNTFVRETVHAWKDSWPDEVGQIVKDMNGYLRDIYEKYIKADSERRGRQTIFVTEDKEDGYFITTLGRARIRVPEADVSRIESRRTQAGKDELEGGVAIEQLDVPSGTWSRITDESLEEYLFFFFLFTHTLTEKGRRVLWLEYEQTPGQVRITMMPEARYILVNTSQKSAEFNPPIEDESGPIAVKIAVNYLPLLPFVLDPVLRQKALDLSKEGKAEHILAFFRENFGRKVDVTGSSLGKATEKVWKAFFNAFPQEGRGALEKVEDILFTLEERGTSENEDAAEKRRQTLIQLAVLLTRSGKAQKNWNDVLDLALAAAQHGQEETLESYHELNTLMEDGKLTPATSGELAPLLTHLIVRAGVGANKLLKAIGWLLAAPVSTAQTRDAALEEFEAVIELLPRIEIPDNIVLRIVRANEFHWFMRLMDLSHLEIPSPERGLAWLKVLKKLFDRASSNAHKESVLMLLLDLYKPIDEAGREDARREWERLFGGLTRIANQYEGKDIVDQLGNLQKDATRDASSDSYDLTGRDPRASSLGLELVAAIRHAFPNAAAQATEAEATMFRIFDLYFFDEKEGDPARALVGEARILLDQIKASSLYTPDNESGLYHFFMSLFEGLPSETLPNLERFRVFFESFRNDPVSGTEIVPSLSAMLKQGRPGKYLAGALEAWQILLQLPHLTAQNRGQILSDFRELTQEIAATSARILRPLMYPDEPFKTLSHLLQDQSIDAANFAAIVASLRHLVSRLVQTISKRKKVFRWGYEALDELLTQLDAAPSLSERLSIALETTLHARSKSEEALHDLSNLLKSPGLKEWNLKGVVSLLHALPKVAGTSVPAILHALQDLLESSYVTKENHQEILRLFRDLVALMPKKALPREEARRLNLYYPAAAPFLGVLLSGAETQHLTSQEGQDRLAAIKKMLERSLNRTTRIMMLNALHKIHSWVRSSLEERLPTHRREILPALTRLANQYEGGELLGQLENLYDRLEGGGDTSGYDLEGGASLGAGSPLSQKTGFLRIALEFIRFAFALLRYAGISGASDALDQVKKLVAPLQLKDRDRAKFIIPKLALIAKHAGKQTPKAYEALLKLTESEWFHPEEYREILEDYTRLTEAIYHHTEDNGWSRKQDYLGLVHLFTLPLRKISSQRRRRIFSFMTRILEHVEGGASHFPFLGLGVSLMLDRLSSKGEDFDFSLLEFALVHAKAGAERAFQALASIATSEAMSPETEDALFDLFKDLVLLIENSLIEMPSKTDMMHAYHFFQTMVHSKALKTATLEEWLAWGAFFRKLTARGGKPENLVSTYKAVASIYQWVHDEPGARLGLFRNDIFPALYQMVNQYEGEELLGELEKLSARLASGRENDASYEMAEGASLGRQAKRKKKEDSAARIGKVFAGAFPAAGRADRARFLKLIGRIKKDYPKGNDTMLNALGRIFESVVPGAISAREILFIVSRLEKVTEILDIQENWRLQEVLASADHNQEIQASALSLIHLLLSHRGNVRRPVYSSFRDLFVSALVHDAALENKMEWLKFARKLAQRSGSEKFLVENFRILDLIHELVEPVSIWSVIEKIAGRRGTGGSFAGNKEGRRRFWDETFPELVRLVNQFEEERLAAEIFGLYTRLSGKGGQDSYEQVQAKSLGSAEMVRKAFIQVFPDRTVEDEERLGRVILAVESGAAGLKMHPLYYELIRLIKKGLAGRPSARAPGLQDGRLFAVPPSSRRDSETGGFAASSLEYHGEIFDLIIRIAPRLSDDVMISLIEALIGLLESGAVTKTNHKEVFRKFELILKRVIRLRSSVSYGFAEMHRIFYGQGIPAQGLTPENLTAVLDLIRTIIDLARGNAYYTFTTLRYILDASFASYENWRSVLEEFEYLIRFLREKKRAMKGLYREVYSGMFAVLGFPAYESLPLEERIAWLGLYRKMVARAQFPSALKDLNDHLRDIHFWLVVDPKQPERLQLYRQEIFPELIRIANQYEGAEMVEKIASLRRNLEREAGPTAGYNLRSADFPSPLWGEGSRLATSVLAGSQPAKVLVAGVRGESEDLPPHPNLLPQEGEGIVEKGRNSSYKLSPNAASLGTDEGEEFGEEPPPSAEPPEKLISEWRNRIAAHYEEFMPEREERIKSSFRDALEVSEEQADDETIERLTKQIARHIFERAVAMRRAIRKKMKDEARAPFPTTLASIALDLAGKFTYGGLGNFIRGIFPDPVEDPKLVFHELIESINSGKLLAQISTGFEAKDEIEGRMPGGFDLVQYHIEWILSMVPDHIKPLARDEGRLRSYLVYADAARQFYEANLGLIELMRLEGGTDVHDIAYDRALERYEDEQVPRDASSLGQETADGPASWPEEPSLDSIESYASRRGIVPTALLQVAVWTRGILAPGAEREVVKAVLKAIGLIGDRDPDSIDPRVREFNRSLAPFLAYLSAGDLQSQRMGVFTALLSSRRKPGSSVLNQGTGKTLDSRFRGNDSALNTSLRMGAGTARREGSSLGQSEANWTDREKDQIQGIKAWIFQTFDPAILQTGYLLNPQGSSAYYQRERDSALECLETILNFISTKPEERRAQFLTSIKYTVMQTRLSSHEALASVREIFVLPSLPVELEEESLKVVLYFSQLLLGSDIRFALNALQRLLRFPSTAFSALDVEGKKQALWHLAQAIRTTHLQMAGVKGQFMERTFLAFNALLALLVSSALTPENYQQVLEKNFPVLASMLTKIRLPGASVLSRTPLLTSLLGLLESKALTPENLPDVFARLARLPDMIEDEPSSPIGPSFPNFSRSLKLTDIAQAVTVFRILLEHRGLGPDERSPVFDTFEVYLRMAAAAIKPFQSKANLYLMLKHLEDRLQVSPSALAQGLQDGTGTGGSGASRPSALAQGPQDSSETGGFAASSPDPATLETIIQEFLGKPLLATLPWNLVPSLDSSRWLPILVKITKRTVSTPTLRMIFDVISKMQIWAARQPRERLSRYQDEILNPVLRIANQYEGEEILIQIKKLWRDLSELNPDASSYDLSSGGSLGDEGFLSEPRSPISTPEVQDAAASDAQHDVREAGRPHFARAARPLERPISIVIETNIFDGGEDASRLALRLSQILHEGDLFVFIRNKPSKPPFLTQLYRETARGAKARIRDLDRKVVSGSVIDHMTKEYPLPLWIRVRGEEGLDVVFSGDTVQLDLKVLARYGIDASQVVALLRQMADHPAARPKLFAMAGLMKTGTGWEVGEAFATHVLALYKEAQAHETVQTAA